MQPLINLFRIDKDNVGDLSSTPCRYFPFGREVLNRDIGEESKPTDIIIAGGGGLFQFKKIEEHIKSARLAIGWGIGSNDHHVSHATPPPEWAEGFALLGCRDKDAERWVPCPSCMSPEFNRLRASNGLNEFVLYDHWLFGVGSPDELRGIPRATNKDFDFSKTIEFLASGRTVLTTSYHGAYWASLLERPCVVINPWSSKFYTLKHAPMIATLNNWRDAAEHSSFHPLALEECRAANAAFYNDVLELIESS